MAAMVEYPSWDNGALSAGLSKSCAFFLAASMPLSADYGKGMVEGYRENSTLSAMRLCVVFLENTSKHR